VRRTRGFTLLQAIAVLIATMAAVALIGIRDLWLNGEPPKGGGANAQIAALKGSLDLYKLDNGTFPTTQQGLQALRVRPADAPKWSGPYIPQDVPRDPWGHDWVYKFPGDHGNEPDIISFGADGRPGGDGINADIVSWTTP